MDRAAPWGRRLARPTTPEPPGDIARRRGAGDAISEGGGVKKPVQLAMPGFVHQPPLAMTKPLALLLHEKPLPGSRLGPRLEELDYRVVSLTEPAELPEKARTSMPMIVLADLTNRRGDVLAAVAAMRADTATAHVPVLAYAAREDEKQREAALKAGVTVLATDATILPHLEHFLTQALHIE